MSTYSVQFVGHVIQDEFTEYHMKVTSNDGTSWLVRRRYREFRELHDHLKLKYPDRIPSMPGKKLWGNEDPSFVKQRQDQLQVYMDGILSLEPDCRTRVVQRFLEIKKTGGSPVIETAASPARVPLAPPPQAIIAQPALASSSQPSSSSARPTSNRSAELQSVVSELERTIFDLSVQPSLLDAGEYAMRRKKYEQIISSAQVPSTPQELRKTPPAGASVWEKAAWNSNRQAGYDAAAGELGKIIGNAPIATERDLVAFFTVPAVAESL